MDLKLPPEVLKTLPEPGEDGLVRVTAALKMMPGGEAELVSVNDTPVPMDDEGEKDAASEEDGAPPAEGDGGDYQAPDLGAMADSIYGKK